MTDTSGFWQEAPNLVRKNHPKLHTLNAAGKSPIPAPIAASSPTVSRETPPPSPNQSHHPRHPRNQTTSPPTCCTTRRVVPPHLAARQRIPLVCAASTHPMPAVNNTAQSRWRMCATCLFPLFCQQTLANHIPYPALSTVAVNGPIDSCPVRPVNPKVSCPPNTVE
ncbi:hypothetical protein CCHOA_01575 [Corynebacterium choanae]|uniref:Uncharacterized protein n=1 Tax=Corynebacterium choanae TaxID=1862358 RepID=A0A3G6J4T3_9CORY|nr:hypothetical protein CCHOA_01575 [Corynebacterium choanae]